MFIVRIKVLLLKIQETTCCTTEKSDKDCCSSSNESPDLDTILQNHNLVIAIVQNVLMLIKWCFFG